MAAETASFDEETMQQIQGLREWWRLQMDRERELREIEARQMLLDFDGDSQDEEEATYARVA